MNRGIFLSAKWEYLAMFNYEVDAAVLEEHLPPYTEVDYFNGMALVSVVGFLFNNTSVMGVKWPGFVNFEEVNLRYYIKHFNGNQWKRGVGFVSEIVPSAIVAGLANRLYNEHYSTAKMKHSIDVKDDQLHVEYKWKRKNEEWNTMQVKAADRLYDIEPGSEEEFIFEHYSGYNKLNRNTTIEYTVAHPRWQVYPVKEFILSCNIEKLYGKAFIPFITDRQPHSVFLAKGSEVSVGKPLRVTHSTVKKHYSFI